MVKMEISILAMVLCALNFEGIIASCSFVNPELTWPLGRGILNKEITTNPEPEAIGDFTFLSSPLSYDGIHFFGNTTSYVDLRIGNLALDYTLYFHVNPTVHGGCILHYMSDSQTSTGITEYRLDMESDGRLTYSVSGNGITLKNGGSVTGSFAVPVSQWSTIIVAYDVSKKHPKITADDWSAVMDDDVLDSSSDQVWPGTLRIGSSQDGSGSSFHGGVVCFHKVPDKSSCVLTRYQTECEGNWATTSTSTSTSTSTTTPTSTSTSTSTTTPTSTSTSTTTPTSTSTSTTTPTSTSTTSTPTTTLTSMSTSTTTPIPTSTSTSTLTLPVTTTVQATTTLFPVTTTVQTTTTTLPVTTTTTTLITTYLPLSLALHDQHQIQTGCREYHRYNTSAGYAHSSDVISTVLVSDVRECLLECDKLNDCMTFSFELLSDSINALCKTGKLSPTLEYLNDCSMFRVV